MFEIPDHTDELEELRKLYAQMRANVESRSKSPKWLTDQLNKIAQVRNDGDVSPGAKYGQNIKYELCDITKVRKRSSIKGE